MSRKFTDEQEEQILKDLLPCRAVLEAFMNPQLLKDLDTWRDEALVNGVPRTLIQITKYVNDFENGDLLIVRRTEEL